MDTAKDYDYDSIVTYLKKRPHGASVSEISRDTNHTRATVAKYLEILNLKSEVVCRTVGKAKVWNALKDSRKSVLIVSKEPNFIKLLKIALGSTEYDFNSFSDGDSVLGSLVDDMPDLLLLHPGAPGKSWQDICRIMKENPLTNNVPILIIFERLTQRDRETARRCGADDYISMPLDTDTLKSKINSFFRPNKGTINIVTNLPATDAASEFYDRNKNRISLGVLMSISESDAYKQKFGKAKLDELLRILSQLIKEQTVFFDKNCYLSHLNESDFLVMYHLLSDEEAMRCYNHITLSFKEIFHYLSEYSCPVLNVKILKNNELQSYLAINPKK